MGINGPDVITASLVSNYTNKLKSTKKLLPNALSRPLIFHDDCCGPLSGKDGFPTSTLLLRKELGWISTACVGRVRVGVPLNLP